MSQLVFFLEEPSAREMLKGLLPRILPDEHDIRFIVFEGKQDLEKRLPRRLRAWQNPDANFVVLRDKDSEDCAVVKQRLVELCRGSGKPDVLVRIACHELEAWYLGDLAAVADGIGPSRIRHWQGKKKYRAPDNLANAAQILKMIAPGYQKVAGSRAIGPHMSLDNNCSTSFRFFVAGVQRMVNNGENA